MKITKSNIIIALLIFVCVLGITSFAERIQEKQQSIRTATINKATAPFGVSIVIPAYNEEGRIERTLRRYHQFFTEKQQEGLLSFELVVVVNGSTDNTIGVVERVKNDLATSAIVVHNLVEGGKGFAIKAGFMDALSRSNDLIGFVDADMATVPEAFYDLIVQMNGYDGTIASRYMPGAQIYPPRPAYKRWGSRIFYEPIVNLLFGLSYYDFQCGAKIFKNYVLETVTPSLTVRQWGFDVELLYLCKKAGYIIKEVPTVWHDQDDSKLTLFGGLRMLLDLFYLRFQHSLFSFF